MQNEFDVIKMIKKVRLANDLWTNILTTDQLKLMKFQNSCVINLDHDEKETELSDIGEDTPHLTENSIAPRNQEQQPLAIPNDSDQSIEPIPNSLKVQPPDVSTNQQIEQINIAKPSFQTGGE